MRCAIVTAVYLPRSQILDGKFLSLCKVKHKLCCCNEGGKPACTFMYVELIACAHKCALCVQRVKEHVTMFAEYLQHMKSHPLVHVSASDHSSPLIFHFLPSPLLIRSPSPLLPPPPTLTAGSLCARVSCCLAHLVALLCFSVMRS